MSPGWCDKIPWYPDGCFGPYRGATIGYSRRELAADGMVHVCGVAFGLLGVGALLATVVLSKPPTAVGLSLGLYGASLLGMLVCSAVFNGLAGMCPGHIWALQLADHAGILLLICGTYAPTMTLACCPRALCFVWSLGIISFTAKASRSKLDSVALHVPCFLLMGWTALAVWSDVNAAFTPWAKALCVTGGALYTLGLVPWAQNKLEGHNALWHIFVLVASSCFWLVQILETAQPERWQTGAASCLLA